MVPAKRKLRRQVRNLGLKEFQSLVPPLCSCVTYFPIRTCVSEQTVAHTTPSMVLFSAAKWPKVNCDLKILNKQFISFRLHIILNSKMKSHAVPLPGIFHPIVTQQPSCLYNIDYPGIAVLVCPSNLYFT